MEKPYTKEITIEIVVISQPQMTNDKSSEHQNIEYFISVNGDGLPEYCISSINQFSNIEKSN